MTKRADYEPEPMARGLILGVVISLALAVGLLVAVISEPDLDDTERAHLDSGIEFPPLEIDPDKLHQARTQYADEPNLELIEEEAEELRSLFQDLNELQFDHGDPEAQQQVSRLEKTLKYRANDVVTATGTNAFQKVGVPLFDACLDGLQQLLVAVETGRLSMEQAIEDPPSDDFERYRRNCGNLLAQLVRNEIVDDDGTWNHPSGPQLVGILQRYHFVHHLLGDKYPLQMKMNPTDLQYFYRWRFEDDGAFSPARRRAYLDDARGILPDDYDLPLAYTRIDAAAADSPDQVLEHFEQLVDDHPGNDLYPMLHDEIQRQIAAR